MKYLLLCLMGLVSLPSFAQTSEESYQRMLQQANQGKQYYLENYPAQEENCWVAAGQKYQIDPWLLYAIAKVESSHNPVAVGVNTNKTYDIGIMQVNSSWLPKLSQYGIKQNDLFEPCKAIHIGAWILAQSIQKNGYNWKAVGVYHSGTPSLRDAYAIKVFNVYNRYKVAHDADGGWVQQTKTFFSQDNKKHKKK